MSLPQYASTGLPGLDEIVHSLRLGDNVVWQVDRMESYFHFASPFIEKALKEGRNLIYIRFAAHPPLIKENKKSKVRTYKVDAAAGFESFSKQIHDIITKEGAGAFYVFDCLSDLLSAWATDLMIGNFFRVTCPYLFELDTVAYFALLRDRHSFRTIARIRETTQLLLDVHDIEGQYYVQPLKVWERHSPTMFLPHLQKNEKFLPLISSVDAVKLFSSLSAEGVEGATRSLDYWDRLFLQAEELVRDKKAVSEKKKMLEYLCRIMMGREKRILSLITKNFTLEDILGIKARMIGTGFIGGKAAGMLLARKILADWEVLMEPHDSFFVGSDVFYTYIVENGWWKLWLEHKTEEGYFEKAAQLKEKMLTGKFPQEIRERFHALVEYFGGAPIIVRSSSLLEDAFGNAFAGKYDSIFDVNQGTPEARYGHFEEIVKKVYASTMNEDALSYRRQRGLRLADEQMALLVQRVSGEQHRQYFFPFVAGVALSYNTFVWHKDMDPKAGMLRMVFGLGTRAVNRVEGDYPRIAALDAPLYRPYAGMEKEKKFSQHDVDVLDLKENVLKTIPLERLVKDDPGIDLTSVAVRDREAEKKLAELGQGSSALVLTFDKLLSGTDFAKTMKEMLKALEESYRYPVDVEFTFNFNAGGEYRINIVQCRPLQAKGEKSRVDIPENIPEAKVVFKAEGNFMGGSVALPLQRIILVRPDAYSDLIMSKKFEVARLIGKLNRMIEQEKSRTLLIGPGRWGTRDPSLGVPVNFAEINNVCALIEVDDPAGGFTPELSFGSHFFLDLTETNIFYAALFMDDEKTLFNKKQLEKLPNALLRILPEAAPYEAVLKVYDLTDKKIKLLSDVTCQQVICFDGGH